MYHHLEGVLAVLEPSRAVVEASGIGFECRIPLSTFTSLKGKEGARVRLMTHLQVLEDDLRLYGFATEKERGFFRLITSIAGVGPAIALAALASFDPPAFAGAIGAGDARALRRIKGVGPKLSERIVLELKDRTEALAALAGEDGPPGGGLRHPALPDAVVSDAVKCLEALGYSLREARERVEAAIAHLLGGAGGSGGAVPAKDGPGAGAPPSVEAIIQAAIRARS